MKPSKAEPIRDYILKDEETFGIAAKIADAWPDVQEKVTTGFLNRLGSRLSKRLKGWRVEPYGGRFFLDAFPGFYVWKPKWKYHAIGIQCEEHGRRMIIGVSNYTDINRKLPKHQEVLAAVQKIQPTAKPNAYWEARIGMQSPESDWSTPAALWRMNTDPTFLNAVADQILEIAEVSEASIDRVYRGKR